MKTCPQCGRSLDDSVQTCECGHDLSALSPAPQASPDQPQAAPAEQLQPAETRSRAKRSPLLSWGAFFLLIGAVALILPLFGYHLVFFRLIEMDSPIYGGVALAIGVILLVIGFFTSRS
jgi:hypothetical protein